MQATRRLARPLLATPLIALFGCLAPAVATRAPGELVCMLEDPRLGAPFKNAAAAREWIVEAEAFLESFAKRLEANDFVPSDEDRAQVADIADLAGRVLACLNEG